MGEITATCQDQRDGSPCGATARYARTLWSAGVVFACGRHLRRIEEFARPVIVQAMGGRGYLVGIVKPHMPGPCFLDVPGAAPPAEHPLHTTITQGEQPDPACWCGAAPVRQIGDEWVWEGGKPLDIPWWEAKRREEAQTA